MTEEEELPPEARVLRVVPDRPSFFPDGAVVPTRLAFDPSDLEKQDAAQKGSEVRISVWDRSRTTVAQAVGFRRAEGSAAEEPFRTYQFEVGKAAAVGTSYGVRVRVVRDPDPDLGDAPGADGHCGLEGTHRTAVNSSKAKAKAIIEGLLHLLEPAND